MADQNYGYGYPYPQNYFVPNGVQYAQQKPVAMAQPLSPAEIAELKQKGPQFSLSLTKNELLGSYCTHKENNQIVAVAQADGSFFCPICGETFSADWTTQQVEEATKVICDMLQTVKLEYLTIPDIEVAKTYYSMIPLLKKLPKLYEIAQNDFAKHEQGSPINPQNNMYGFNMLNMLTNPMSMGYQQPMAYQQPMVQQPMSYQQPMVQQPMVTGAMPTGVNPFGGVGVDPSMAQQPAMTVQPEQAVAPAIQNTKVLNV